MIASIALATVAAAQANTKWTIFSNENAVYGKATAGGNQGDTIYLGTVASADDCFTTAENAAGQYHSATWHTPGFSGSASPFDGQCFGVTGTEWAPRHQNKVISARSPLKCESAEDCSYNGQCEKGQCVCEPQWQGSACGRFSFRPLPPTGHGTPGLKTVLNGSQVSSWGGSVLRHDDGTYHMWAAEMSYSTGIKAWITNSRVVHAVADAPLTDGALYFKRQEEVQPVFAHEPTVSRAPTGEYVMYYTTDYGEVPGSQCGPPCTCGHNGTSCLQCPNDQQCVHHTSPLSTRMSYASSPNGPWSQPQLVPAPTSGDTNLACIIRKDSSLVCVGRPGLGLLTASHWKNLSLYRWSRMHDGRRGEDPMLWVDESDPSILHCVTHGGGWGDPFGFHYWSADGGTSWKGTGTKAYENVVEVTGATSKVLSRRERPHVVLNADGQPIALTNGVTEAWPCTLQHEPDRPPCKHPYTPGVNPHCGPGSNGTSIWCPVDYCYTLWQGLNQS